MVMGVYSRADEGEYFTIENMHCLISRFEEESSEQRQDWIQEFEDISCSDFSRLTRLECLREGVVLTGLVDDLWDIWRVEYSELFEDINSTSRNVRETRGLVVVEPLHPSQEYLVLDISQTENFRGDMVRKEMNVNVLEFDREFSTIDDVREQVSSESGLDEVALYKCATDIELNVVEDECIIDIFDINPDIVGDLI